MRWTTKNISINNQEHGLSALNDPWGMKFQATIVLLEVVQSSCPPKLGEVAKFVALEDFYLEVVLTGRRLSAVEKRHSRD